MEDMKIEVIQNPEVLSTLISTEIDMQIATAKKYPRDVARAMKNIRTLALSSPGVTEACIYALSRKQKNQQTNRMETKIIQGPSVRLAEIVTSQYGNMRSGARVIGNDGRILTAQGFCLDLESNNFSAIEVRRKITNKLGQPYSEDMQILTGNAACKIAYRNAVFTVNPAVLFQDIIDELIVKNRGTVLDLPKRRENAMKWFSQRGVTDVQIFEHFEIKNIEQIDLEKMEILSGMKSSINNGEFTVEDLFPPADDKKKNGKDKADAATQEALNMMDSKKKNKGEEQE
jgi:hypothetical protein